MNIKYRTTISTNDIPQLNALLVSLGGHREPEVWQQNLKISTYIVVAEVDNVIVGMGRIVNDGAMCMIFDIFVTPTYQRKGIASNIMKHITSQINKDELVFVGLFASEEKPFIKKLYRKFGFNDVTYGMRM